MRNSISAVRLLAALNMLGQPVQYNVESIEIPEPLVLEAVIQA